MGQTSEILSTVEQDELQRHEAVIERGLNIFVEVGNALTDIRDRRLYREQYGTFEDYCQGRWGIVASRARQLIGAAKTVTNVTQSVNGTISPPSNEAQARPLTKLPADEQPAVWQEAVETAPNGKVTAQHVEETVKIHINRSKYTCPVCQETFNIKVWHCPICNHHWQMHQTECSNCYNNRPRFPMENYQATIYKPHPKDCCQTPPYALDPLYQYLKTNQAIWEPAAGEGYLVNALSSKGYNVIGSDISTGQNFFEFEPAEWDVLITNPPYHSGVLGQWIERCYKLNKPFALLMKITTLGVKYGFDLFQEYGLELIVFNQRINYKMPNAGWRGGGAQFASGWFTWGLGIGQQITFAELQPIPIKD